MDLVECPVCGEEYPEGWDGCPFCAAKPKRSKPSEDEWN